MLTLYGGLRHNLKGLCGGDEVLHLPPLWAGVKVILVADSYTIKHLQGKAGVHH